MGRWNRLIHQGRKGAKSRRAPVLRIVGEPSSPSSVKAGWGWPNFAGSSIPPTRFYSWRQKLEGPRKVRSRSVSPRPSSFVSVKLASAKAARSSSMLEVCLRGGRRLRVRGAFQRELLVELIDVLEGLA